ncbi:hypothetical protein NQ317_001594 [Molorchus minor]|uniref:C2H2-type domain-containing protein n=1 Tax=Molorchus minor TaxID=1323400 RepID=A0ABQ9IX38_9CUCU|nr:hypothetical protein NQ317_001594 [Molorchus minor]
MKVGMKMMKRKLGPDHAPKIQFAEYAARKYPRSISLKAHLRTHVRLKRYGCKYCELTFTLPTNRDRHEKSHEADPENKYRCNICWKRVKTEEDLERHVAGHSNRPAQHACEVCGERFHRRYLLDNHNLDKHTGPEDIARAEEEIERNLLEYALDP